MNTKHVNFVIIIGMVVLISFLLKEWRLLSLPYHSQNRTYDLTIDGNHLSLRKQNNKSQKATIPTQLTPFFFAPMPIDQVTPELLVTVPGIGPQLAKRILNVRKKQGGSISKQNLLEIKGIGPKKYAKLKTYLLFHDSASNH